MPNFPLDSRSALYDFGSGIHLTLIRPHLRLTPCGAAAAVHCYLNTGQHLSVVSAGVAALFPRRSVAAANPAGWAGGPSLPAPPAVFAGHPCDLGFTRGVLLDPVTCTQSPPLSITAWFVSAPCPHLFGDRFVILGTQFLQENDASFALQGSAWGAAGHVYVP